MSMREEDRHRPYAAPANIVAVLTRCRTRNLPERIDNNFLRLCGIPQGALGRVLDALRFLRLIDSDGRPTDILRSLSAAPEATYRDALMGTVRTAYEADFERVKPDEDSQATIIQAFQMYEPRSQINRMVMLFLGLCRESGIPVLDAPRERQMRPPARSTNRFVRTPPKQRERQAKEASSNGAQIGQGVLGLLSEDDVDRMSDAEFKEVWAALGTAYEKIARARAKARREERSQQAEVGDGSG